MRLFVAAELPPQILEALSETSASLRDAVEGRFVGSDLFHVTLAFLGERPASEIPVICDLVGEACAKRHAFSTALGELGTFGRSGSAVLWQGFSEGRKEWDALARAVWSQLSALGYTPEHSRFVPHVTLARRANIAGLRIPMPHVDRGIIDCVSLFSSDLSGPRPVYEALDTARLRRV